MIFYIILFLIILGIVIWGGVTRWRFIKGKGKEGYEKEKLDMANYYVNHKSEFKGEDGHDILIEKLKKIIKPYNTNDLILGIDVGSNIGNYINNLKSICNEDNSMILCFEPNPINIPVLEKKILPEKNIILYKFALSNETSVVKFQNYTGKAENDIGNGVAGLRSGGDVICEVEVKKLDDVLDKKFKNDNILIKFIKIDVEGNDTNVIKGFEKYLPKTEYIIFECSDCLDDHRGPGIKNPMKDIVDFLSKNDFNTYRIGTKKLFKVNDECWDDVYEKIKFYSNCFSLKKNNLIINSLIDNEYNYII